jgi:hypothetical protein
MPLSAMTSFIVSFRDMQDVGLAKRTTDCEWAAEAAIDGGVAYSARVTVPAEGLTIAFSDISESSTGVLALAVKAVTGNVSVASDVLAAVISSGGAACYSSPNGPAPAASLALSSPSGQTVQADVVLVLAGG